MYKLVDHFLFSKQKSNRSLGFPSMGVAFPTSVYETTEKARNETILPSILQLDKISKESEINPILHSQ